MLRLVLMIGMSSNRHKVADTASSTLMYEPVRTIQRDCYEA